MIRYNNEKRKGGYDMLDGTNRKHLKIGMLVDIIAEEDRQKGTLTRGYITKILSQSNHAKGVKVSLHNGKTGRVQHILTKDEIRLENFKFYNQFFYLPHLYTIYNQQERQFLVYPHYNSSADKEERTILLFDSEEKALSFIKGTKYAEQPYQIRRIHRKKPIVDLFAECQADFFRINGVRKLSADRMKEWEYYFKNMK